MSLIVRAAEHPRVALAGAAVSTVAEVVSWFTTFDDAWRVTPVAFILTFLFFGLFAFNQYVEAQRLRDAQEPKFDIAFHPGESSDGRPYFQEFDVPWRDDAGLPIYQKRDRRYRVGIVNLCTAVVPKVRVKLADCEPRDNWVHIEHDLAVMNTNPPLAERDLYPSKDGKATLFFDVVAEFDTVGVMPAHFRFEYSDTNLRGPVEYDVRYQGNYSFRVLLRAEGGGWSCERWFKVFKGWDEEGRARPLTMEPL
jgi:hypothetical protein